MLLATLPLFPRYSLDTSILIAVLVGVLILALLTETLGWVFVGLVVPGYLASVFVIHPEAGATVVIEAYLTYALAAALSAGLSRTGAWSEFFGRDRFFAVVLSSVLVRAVCEAWLLPRTAGWLDLKLGTSFALDRTLHSIGLVLVPLTANAFWKLGLKRGSFQVFVPVALTWAVLHFVLLPYTNLSFSSLELTYEDVAQNFLASPKAYILLLTTAVLAARFNLLYGWDFNGILVPALIALTWLSPSKTLMTLVEVIVLVLGTRALLSLPGIRTLNLEGPRKTVVVFTLGFIVKWCVGWALGGRVPGLKVTDLFGFGYLVPTLLAVKILQKQVVARVLLATIHTSFVGFAAGSIIGFALTLIEPATAVALPAQELAHADAPTLGLTRTPLGVMAYARATCRESATDEVPLRRKRGELRRYGQLWHATDAWLTDGDDKGLASLRDLAAPLGLELRALPSTSESEPRGYALLEKERPGSKVGWDTALLFPREPGPVLEVPRPASEAPSAEAAALICARIHCRAIIVSGVDTSLRGLPQGDALNEQDTPLQTANAALGEVARVQLRADASLSAHERPVLHTRTPRSAEGWNWPELFRVSGAPPDPGLAWEDGRTSVLRMHPADLIELVASAAPASTALSTDALDALLLSPREDAGPLRPLPQPTDAELWVLRQQIAAPLLGTKGADPIASAPDAVRERWAAAMASLLDLEVRPVEGPAGHAFAVLDREKNRGRLGAAMVVSPQGEPLAVEVPSPQVETGVLPFGVEAWRSTRAKVLLWNDPALPVGDDQLSPATPGLFRTAFEAFHEAAHVSLPADRGVVLQLRGFSERPGIEDDVVVDLDAPVLDPSQRPQAVVALFDADGPLGWVSPLVRYHDASAELAGVEDASPQQSFSKTFGGARLSTLWLSRQLRGAYQPPRLDDEALQLTHLGQQQDWIAPSASMLADNLIAPQSASPRPLHDHFQALAQSADRAVSEQSIHDLRALAQIRDAGSIQQSVRAHYSPEHGLWYLVLEARQGRHVLRGITFLQQLRVPLPRVELRAGSEGWADAVERALRSRVPVVIEGDLAEGVLARKEPRR